MSHNIWVERVSEHANDECINTMADNCLRVLDRHDFYRHIDKAHNDGQKGTQTPQKKRIPPQCGYVTSERYTRKKGRLKDKAKLY